MALRHIEGFEGQRDTGLFARAYASSSGSITSQAGQRIGNAVASNSLVLRTFDLLDGGADQNTWVIGFAFRATTSGWSNSATTHPYFAFRNASGEQIRLEIAPSVASFPGGGNYKLRVVRGSTTLATSVQTFNGANADGAWTYFEFKVTVRTGTNGSFSARYHDKKSRNVAVTWDATTTGVNTANQGADGADRAEMSLSNNNTVTLALDNVYILDSSGSVNNDMIGEVEIEAMDVSGNGDTNQWVLNGGAASLEDAWNESAIVQSTPEDDARVSSSVVGHISLATLTNPTYLRNVTIVGTQMRLFCRMEASGTRDIQHFYRKTTGTPAQVGTKITTLSSTSIVCSTDTRETDPNTSATWLPADLDGLQVGVELDA